MSCCVISYAYKNAKEGVVMDNNQFEQDQTPVNEPVNDVLKDILEFIKNNPGVKKPAIITHIGKSKATLTRYLKQLVERNYIEYKGSDKTGGYYLKSSE